MSLLSRSEDNGHIVLTMTIPEYISLFALLKNTPYVDSDLNLKNMLYCFMDSRV